VDELGVVAPAVTRPRTAVRVDDDRQVLGLDPLGSREVTVDRQPVARRKFDRLHGRQVFARQIRTRFVEELRLPRLHIEEVGDTGVDVARHSDDMEAVVIGGRNEKQISVTDLLLQVLLELLVGFLPFLVFPVDTEAVPFVCGPYQLLRHVREHRAPEIDFLLRIGLDELGRSRRGIEQHQLLEVVLLALVRRHVGTLAVPLESDD